VSVWRLPELFFTLAFAIRQHKNGYYGAHATSVSRRHPSRTDKKKPRPREGLGGIRRSRPKLGVRVLSRGKVATQSLAH
jgi:hypothetical protein